MKNAPKTGSTIFFKAKLWAEMGAEISATPVKNSDQHSSKKVRKIFEKN